MFSGSSNLWHFVILAIFIAIVVVLLRLLVVAVRPTANEVANTFKFRTVVFIILALVIPLWIITLPVFLYLAYKSYCAGAIMNDTSVVQ